MQQPRASHLRPHHASCATTPFTRACGDVRGRPQTVKQTSQVASVVIRDTTFGSMGAVEPPAWMSAAACRWLENACATAEDAPGRAFNTLPLSGARACLS